MICSFPEIFTRLKIIHMWGHSAKVASSFPSSSDIRGVKPSFLRPHLLLGPTSSSSGYSSSSSSSLHVARPIALPKNVDLRQQVSDFSLQVAVLARWNCKMSIVCWTRSTAFWGKYLYFYNINLSKNIIYLGPKFMISFSDSKRRNPWWRFKVAIIFALVFVDTFESI